jgi:signal transduction histidine kinase
MQGDAAELQKRVTEVEAHTAELKKVNEGLQREVNQRKRAEEEISRLARFPSENPNPVLRVTTDGTIIYANEASLPLLDVWGCQVGQLLPDDWRKFTFDVLSSGSYKDAEVECGNRILSLTFAPVADADYLNVYGLDVTERKRAEEALKRSNEELLNEQNQRRILSKRLIELLEKDRHDIGMELHDHIGQTLTSLKMNIEMIHGKLKPDHTELGAQIKAAQERAIQAIKDVKNVAHGLRPTMIEALGVVSCLRELFSEIQQQTDMEIRFFSRRIPKRFEGEKELAI